nr:uncharacterized protein LOC120969727 [Aegilops tauschii subsp. strangulata]
MKRAQDAEDQLKPVAEEQSGLKHHISQMTEAIFGARSSNLGQNMLMKLKAVYSLTEKLYAGSLRTLVAASNGKKPPQLVKDVLDQLSKMSKKIEELKMSGAHA